MDGMVWKCEEYVWCGIVLVEIMFFGFCSGYVLDYFIDWFSVFCVVFDFNLDCELFDDGVKLMFDLDLIGLMCMFIVYVKSNCLLFDDMVVCLQQMFEDYFKECYCCFLEIVGLVMQVWDNVLIDEKSIDFEDMLNMVVSLLEQDWYVLFYDLVMVDEFQDVFCVCVCFCCVLVKQFGRFLFVVGDDWQLINCFVGVDVLVMIGFCDWMG